MMGTVISKCHCGSIELELILPDGLENLRRCNCSICSRRNAVVASALGVLAVARDGVHADVVAAGAGASIALGRGSARPISGVSSFRELVSRSPHPRRAPCPTPNQGGAAV